MEIIRIKVWLVVVLNIKTSGQNILSNDDSEIPLSP